MAPGCNQLKVFKATSKRVFCSNLNAVELVLKEPIHIGHMYLC